MSREQRIAAGGIAAITVDTPDHGRDRYQPILVQVRRVRYRGIAQPQLAQPQLAVCRFKPVLTDATVYAYGTNGSPRDRMRHDALLRGERPRCHPHQPITAGGSGRLVGNIQQKPERDGRQRIA